MRGALVLFDGLLPTVIDSQVLAHVRLAREKIGIEITVIAVACSRALFELSEARLEHARKAAGGAVHLIRGIRPALPASMSINRTLLGRALDAIGPVSFVHARSDYAAAVTGPLARRRSLPMLWDCRGDSRAELRDRLSKLSPLFLPVIEYRSAIMRRDLQMAGKYCAGACFVTPQLRDLMAEFLTGQPSWVIPCLAPEAEFFFDPVLRNEVRSELNILSDDPVYVYSGSLAAYQRFDETIETFRLALARNPKARLIVLTPELDRARQKCAGLPADRVICRSVGHAQVNRYLNAADFGMLLRDASPVNQVAFPTKFAEYSMAGLQVFMGEAPPSCVQAARKLGNYCALGTQGVPSPLAERARWAADAKSMLGRDASMSIYSGVYNALVHSRQATLRASPSHKTAF
jgi:glycosyltransferase involved in cell wall biosynthesis